MIYNDNPTIVSDMASKNIFTAGNFWTGYSFKIVDNGSPKYNGGPAYVASELVPEIPGVCANGIRT